MRRWQPFGDEKPFLVDRLWHDVSVHQETWMNLYLTFKSWNKICLFHQTTWSTDVLHTFIQVETQWRTSVIHSWWSFLLIAIQRATSHWHFHLKGEVKLHDYRQTRLSTWPWTEIVPHTGPRVGINNPEASVQRQGSRWKAKIFQHSLNSPFLCILKCSYT